MGALQQAIMMASSAAAAGPPVTLRAWGAVNSASGGNLQLPAGWQVGDLHLMLLESANEAITGAPAGWTQITNSPQGTGTAASTTASMLSIFYRFAQSGDAAITITGTYNHVNGFIIGFYNVNATTPFDVSPVGNVEASSTTAIVYPSITTITDGCLVLYAVSNMVDTNTAQVTTSTFAGLTNILGPYGGNNSAANGGGTYLFTGDMAVAGSTGTGSATAANTTVQGRITLALRRA